MGSTQSQREMAHLLSVLVILMIPYGHACPREASPLSQTFEALFAQSGGLTHKRGYSNPKSFVFNHQKAAFLGRMPFILLAQGFSPG